MNKKILYDKTYKEILWIIVLSIVVLGIISGANVNFGLYDDNQTQWLPIIDTAYAEFFRSGHFPVYDWYQMKGMIIYDQGYYGLWNPFMLIAYVVNTYLLGWIGSNTITVYITLMIILGNICCFYIFRAYEVKRRYALLGSQIMCQTTVFFFLAYWYYVFNVYFIFTWLLLILVKYQGRRGYYCHGVVLAISVLMGNIQYTVYMCLGYAVVMLVLSRYNRVRYLLQLCTNLLVMGMFSSCYLWMLLQVSARSADFSSNNSAYYDMTVQPIWFALFSWIPSELIGGFKNLLENLFGEISILGSVGIDEFPKAASMFLGAEILCVVVFLIKRGKYRKDRLFQIVEACTVSAAVLLIISFGKAGLLAVLMERLPLWNSFRILSKFLVLLPVLLVPATVLVVSSELEKNKIFRILFGVFFILGIMQSRTGSVGAPEIDLSQTYEKLQENGVETEKYRIAGVSSYEEISYEGDWKKFQEKDSINLYEKISKNVGTTISAYTLGGYDLSFENSRFTLSDGIMQSESGYASEFGYDNLIISDYFWNYLNPEEPEYAKRVEKWREQIEDNCVKYFIFSKSSPDVERFVQLLSEAGLEMEWKRDFMEHTCIISIRNIPSLVVDENGKDVLFESSMDRIIIPDMDAGKIYLSFAYDSHIHAYMEGKDGKTQELEVMPDEKGYFIIKQNKGESGRIILKYENTLYLIGKIWTIFVIIGAIVCLCIPEKNGKCKERKQQNISLKKLYCQHKVDHLALILLCILAGIYIIFIGFFYGHTQVLSADEIWFLHMFQTINHHFMENPFTIIGETENYLGYGQIFWIMGGIIDNILILRIISLVSLAGCFFLLMLSINKIYGEQYMPYAGLLWLSMPYAWYTDKIIGPELIGMFLSFLGFYFIMVKREQRAAGWLLVGIGCAIKMNYAVFFLMAVCQEYIASNREWKSTVKRFLSGTGLSGIGFLMSNPIILLDIGTFLENERMSNGLDLNMLTEVILRKRNEWDGVMVNGLCYGYIHWIIILVVIILYLLRKDRNQQMEAVIFCCVVLIYICSRTSFLGWYLLPMLFFIPLILCGQWKRDKDITEMGRLGLFLLILLNGILLLPVHIQGRREDIQQIGMAIRKEENMQELREQSVLWELEYPEEPLFYLTEFNYGEYSYSFEDYYRFCIVKEGGIAVIGKRMENIPIIKQIMDDAKEDREHMEIVTTLRDMTILRRCYE